MKPLIKLLVILIILTWYLGFVFGVFGWCEDTNILYINEDVLNSFEKVENQFNDKVWHAEMYSPQQYFYNSIWLTDKEYLHLKKYKWVSTHYRNKQIEIRIDLKKSISEEDIIPEVLPIIAMAESTNRAWVVGSAGEAGKYQISPILLSDYNNRLSKHRNPVKYEHLFNENVNEMICRWQLNNIISALKKHNLCVCKAHIIHCWNTGIKHALNNSIPKSHKNLIYRKVYKEYWKNK